MKSITLDLAARCLMQQDNAYDGHMIILSVVNCEPILNIIGEPMLDKRKAAFVCEPFNYQPLYKAISYVIEKKGYREYISCPIFYYDLNLN